MKINFFKNTSGAEQEMSQDHAQQVAPGDELIQEAQAMEEEEVSNGTKIKVIAAFIIVGLATYAAYWVQEPTDIQADLLSTQATQDVASQDITTEDVATQDTETAMVALDNGTQSSEEGGFTQEISIHDFAFSPQNITVEKGTTVIWTNTDAVPHTVTGANFSSNTLNSGDSFTKTFQEDATLSYHCSFHPQMQGTLTVGAGTVEGTTQIATETDTQVEPALSQELKPAALEVDPATVVSGNSMDMETLDVEKFINDQPQIHNASYDDGYKADAYEGSNTKLSQSGPEDMVYVAIFGLVLYLNRKKFLSALQ